MLGLEPWFLSKLPREAIRVKPTAQTNMEPWAFQEFALTRALCGQVPSTAVYQARAGGQG